MGRTNKFVVFLFVFLLITLFISRADRLIHGPLTVESLMVSTIWGVSAAFVIVYAAPFVSTKFLRKSLNE